MLAAPVPQSAVTDPSSKIEAFAGGKVVASATLDWETQPPSASAECQTPTPTLPPPGPQPADPAAARAAVEHTFDVIYGPSTEAEKQSVVDDPDHSLAPIRAELAAGTFKDAVESARAQIDGVVFDQPDHAWVQYTIVTSMGSFTQRFGEVSVVDGSWKIAESSVCRDVALAGVHCTP